MQTKSVRTLSQDKPVRNVLWIALLAVACAAPPEEHDDRILEWSAMQHELQRIDAEPAIDEGTSLGALLLHAQRANPELRAAFERWRAALARVPQAGALPEPRLSFAAYLAEVETRVGAMQGRIGLTQPLPWFGELGLKADAAFDAAESAREEVEAVRVEVVAAVLDAWYEAIWLERAIEIATAHRELLVNWEEVGRSRFASGIGSHADVIRSQVELGDLENRLLSLRDLRRPLRARLNAALDRPLDAPLPTAAGPLPTPPELDEARLAAGLAKTSPKLRALDQRIEAAGQGVRLAKKAFYPDFSVGADYTFIDEAKGSGVSGSGDDAFALSLGLELPLWRSRYRAGAREAEALEKAARLDYDAAANRLGLALETALYRFRDGHRRVGLLRDTLIPKGEEAVASLDASYRAGDAGFLDLVDAERALLEFQLQAVRAETDRAQAVAEIERITGVPLTEVEG
jgi:outer membrane protein TolC